MRRFYFLLSALLAGSVAAQDVQTLAASGFHPVTENGRVIWTDGSGLDDLSLYLWDGEATVVLDERVSVALVGWPDLDASGRVAYVQLVGGRYELMLWDGIETHQLTHQSNVPGSDVDLGTPSADLKGGFPRIATGDVVFKSATGDVYLYELADHAIRRISTGPDQRALQTTAENRNVMQMTGIKPVFEFDGRTILWRHQQPGDQRSTFTIWRADAPGWQPRALTTFEAATPRGMNGVIAGALADPNVVACGDDVAWAYRPPATVPAGVPERYAGYATLTQDVVVGAHDGTEAREVARGNVNPLSLGVSGGTVAWIEYDEEEGGRDLVHVRAETAGRGRTIKTVPDPPGQAPAGSEHWRSPNGVFVQGAEVLWVEEQVRCQPVSIPGLPNACLYPAAEQWGVFSSSRPASPQRTFPFGELLLGGSFDQGRYVWRSSDNSIKTTVLVPGATAEGGVVQLVDLMPDRVPLREGDGRMRVVDGFSLHAPETGGECAPGGESGTGATISGLTLSLGAESGILADLSDIAAVRVILDTDGDLQRGGGDRVLAEATALGARQRLDFDAPVEVPPGEHVVVLIEIELRDASEVCPCNRYTVALDGEDLETGSVVVQGRSAGTLVLPPPTIEAVWGDAQVVLPGGTLPDVLGFRVKDFPARCGDARFALVNRVSGDDAVLLDASGGEHTELELPLEPVEDGAEAEVRMRLGSREGAYFVEATLALPEGTTCEPPGYTFVERAGTFVLQVVDANDPAFTEAVQDVSTPRLHTWHVSLTADPAALAAGGEERIGATADGASPLLVRARLLGFTEPPPGEVTFSVESDGEAGTLSPGLGETMPEAGGAATSTSPWYQTPAGIVAFALYTPPNHFGDPEQARRPLRFRATYTLPETGQTAEEQADLHLYRPPILLAHGMWSEPGTWSAAFTTPDPRFDTYLVDYSDLAARDFSTLGHVMRSEVAFALDQRRIRRIATGKVDVVAHSMGGLITRQYVSELQSESYRRPDNLGQGDVHRLVTIGTPHHGSPLAWLAMQLREQAPRVAEVLFAAGMDIYSGAAEAMCPGSPQLQQLGETHVLAHTVRAWHFDSFEEDYGWDTFYDYLDGIADLDRSLLDPFPDQPPPNLLLYSLKYASALGLRTGVQWLYGSDKTDYLVTLASQGGGIGQGQNDVFDQTLHIGMESQEVTLPDGTTTTVHGETSRQEIATYVFDVLQRDPDDRGPSGFAASLPPPIVENEDIRCQ